MVYGPTFMVRLVFRVGFSASDYFREGIFEVCEPKLDDSCAQSGFLRKKGLLK